MKLCLGTAQFGLDYGINNTRGKIPQKEVLEILNFAHESGINTLDTASAYGNSESALGDAITQSGKKFQIITKYPANTEVRPFQWINTSFELLKTERVHGCLFHNYSIFKQHPDYIEDFVKIKDTNKTEKIGFSLYYPSEAEYILENNIPCDIVQVPYNIFDQRFEYIFRDLKSKGIEIYVRSIFLQGLFFIDPEHLDPYFISIKNNLQELRSFAKHKSVDISVLSLKFANMNTYIDKIVIGVDSLDNLKNNINNYILTSSIKIDLRWFRSLAVVDERLILPINWKVKTS